MSNDFAKTKAIIKGSKLAIGVLSEYRISPGHKPRDISKLKKPRGQFFYSVLEKHFPKLLKKG